MNTPISRRLRFSICKFSAAALILLGGNVYGGTVHTVTSLSGGFAPGTLIFELSGAAPGDTINFAVTGTIIEPAGGIIINKSVSIVGPGARKLRLTTNDPGFPLFWIQSGDIHISGLTFSADVFGGNGGINLSGGTLTMDDCAVSGLLFGGIGVAAAATLNLNRCTFSGNGGSGNGGGVHNEGTTTAINCTFSGNSASGTGGAIYGDGGTVSLINCTVTGNSATTSAGGIRRGAGTFRVANTIVAGNTSPNNTDCFGTFVSDGYNLIGLKGGSFGFTDGVNHDIVGQTGSPRDPLLLPLENNGGGTDTTAILLAASPAHNAANPATASARDQRGFVRPDTADIGACEFNGTQPVNLANISSRAVVQTGDFVMIGGFIIPGERSKKVMIRAIGPSLGFPGALLDPILDLRDSTGQLVTSNDDWQNAPNVQAIIDSTIAPTSIRESAILQSLNPGSYTATVHGFLGGTGTALVEVYDLDRMVDSRLANISTRAFVQSGDDILIGGFIVIGPDNLPVIVRAIGTSLTGVPNHMLDPTLELHNGSGTTLATNDDWRTAQQAEIIATGIPPTNDLESAIVETLVPGNYTAIVRGVNNTQGVAVVEVYGLLP